MSKKDTTRRTFIKRIGIGGAGILTSPSLFQLCSIYSDSHASTTFSHVFESKNGTPEQNVSKVIELMGGIESFIGNDNIVIIKPNAQWQNAATTNTNNIKGLIELIFNRPGGFTGEIIIAENIHFSDPRSKGGWATTARNGDYNLNELITFFNNQGFANVTGYALQDRNRGGKIVTGPAEGDGTVITDTVYTHPETGRRLAINYPIFTSEYSGTTIDMKNGAWKNGQYISNELKFINFHTAYGHSIPGLTSTIKNYLGVVDLSARVPDNLSFHDIGVPAPSDPIAGAVGTYLNTVRHATLNILSAEWLGNRNRLGTHSKKVVASIDPAALGFYIAKYVTTDASWDPDNPDSKYGRWIRTFHAQGIGTINESEMGIHKYDFDNPTVQRSDIDKKIKEYKTGAASEQEVKDIINDYMESQ